MEISYLCVVLLVSITPSSTAAVGAALVLAECSCHCSEIATEGTHMELYSAELYKFTTGFHSENMGRSAMNCDVEPSPLILPLQSWLTAFQTLQRRS